MKFESHLPPEAYENMSESFEEARPVISEKELETLCSGNEQLEKLLESMIEYSLRYAEDVWSMHIFVNEGGFDSEDGAEKFAELDAARTILHNALIDSIAILSRNLNKEGKDNSWVQTLADGTSLNRASCGSFALLLVYNRYLDTTGN